MRDEEVWLGFPIQDSLWQDARTRMPIEVACRSYKSRGGDED
jgi:hypothetical protein